MSSTSDESRSHESRKEFGALLEISGFGVREWDESVNGKNFGGIDFSQGDILY